MRPQYDGWQKASHHAVAVCVDCHLPPGGIEKWIAKADNGYRHSKAFTFQDFHEPIRMTRRNAEILQSNCLRCHADFVHEQVAGATTADDAIQCVHCHSRVGHGPRAGLGGAWRAAEERETKERSR
jgi:cytochrome c nitrite reductase small subunit